MMFLCQGYWVLLPGAYGPPVIPSAATATATATATTYATATATAVHNTPQVTPRERAIAKKVNYATAFGVGIPTLATDTGLSRAEVEVFKKVGGWPGNKTIFLPFLTVFQKVQVVPSHPYIGQ